MQGKVGIVVATLTVKLIDLFAGDDWETVEIYIEDID